MLFSLNESPKITVIYITGVARSGSTLLNILLGNHPEIAALGEINNVARVWKNNEYCACNVRSCSCPLWREVLDNWSQSNISRYLKRYSDLQKQFERLRSIPKLLAKRTTEDSFLEYQKLTYTLLYCLQRRTNKNILIDSSKAPARALALSLIPQIDLRIIHIIRDVHGVAWSLQKSYAKNLRSGIPRDIFPKSPTTTAWRWIIGNLVSEWICHQIAYPTQRILYEELTANPQQCLQNFGKWLDLDFSQVCDKLQEKQNLSAYHAIAGNRLRLQSEIQLTRDVQWQQQMPQTTKYWLDFLAGFFLKRYGYHDNAS